MDRPQVADLGAVVERPGRGGGDLDANGARRSEPQADVEVVDGGERVVHGRRAALEHGLEVGAVVAHGPVPGVGAGERITIDLGRGEPGQVLAHL